MQSGIQPQPNTPAGALLRNCRLRAGLDLGEMSGTLRIRQCFLEAIETGVPHPCDVRFGADNVHVLAAAERFLRRPTGSRGEQVERPRVDAA